MTFSNYEIESCDDVNWKGVFKYCLPAKNKNDGKKYLIHFKQFEVLILVIFCN
jgi:hypothetical protein